MGALYKFEQLPGAEQMRAEARFLGAGAGDGYLYELDSWGQVLSRRRDRYALARLPAWCYAFVEGHMPGERIVKIDAGEAGYLPTSIDREDYTAAQAAAVTKTLNDREGVTEAQAEAMLAGSMFGWHCKGADPDAYQPKERGRGR